MRNFQHKTLLYVFLHPFTLIFSLWVRHKKKQAGDEAIMHYAWFYDKFSEPVRQVRKGAGKWPALEALYNWAPKAGFMGLLESFWMNVRSAQALRNRKEIVVELIHNDAIRMIAQYGEARILSIACGSAQTVFEAISGLENVKVLAIDMDETAIEYSKKLAKKYHIANVEWRLGNILNPATTANGFEPNIVEVVGLFDYLSDKAIVGLLRRICKMSQAGAVIITAHIHPNPEESTLRDIADWDMIYRPISVFKRLMCEGGFEQAKYHLEPHNIFSVAHGETPKPPETV